MATYRRVYDSRHLQADTREPELATEPYARQSSMGYLYLLTWGSAWPTSNAWFLGPHESTRQAASRSVPSEMWTRVADPWALLEVILGHFIFSTLIATRRGSSDAASGCQDTVAVCLLTYVECLLRERLTEAAAGELGCVLLRRSSCTFHRRVASPSATALSQSPQLAFGTLCRLTSSRRHR